MGNLVEDGAEFFEGQNPAGEKNKSSTMPFGCFTSKEGRGGGGGVTNMSPILKPSPRGKP